MRFRYMFILFSLLFACSDDEKTIEIVENNLTFGAALRTLQINNTSFIEGDGSGSFNVLLQERDEENGGLLESVDVYVSYKSHLNTSFDQEYLVKTVLNSEFEIGEFDLPEIELDVPFADIMEVTGKSVSQIVCKDQFKIRLAINLTDGRSFTEGDGSSTIIALGSYWSSPYNYTINVVQPISDNLFVGTYIAGNIIDGPLLETFLLDATSEVVVTLGHSKNVRFIEAYYIISHIQFEEKKLFEVTIACDEVIFANNQFTSREGYCGFPKPPVLLGSDVVNGSCNPVDDSVFEAQLIEGYLGFDGGCGFGEWVSRIRFTKQ